MFTDGFGVAIVIGVVALLLPALWVAWWFIADIGEGAGGAPRTSRYETSGSRLRPAA